MSTIVDLTLKCYRYTQNHGQVDRIQGSALIFGSQWMDGQIQ